MATFILVGYGDQAGYDRTDPAVREAAHEHDARLRNRGFLMGIADSPTQVRHHDGVQVVTSEGPYLRAELPVAGFSVIEAETMSDAVELASATPCAVAYGVVEVWPLQV